MPTPTRPYSAAIEMPETHATNPVMNWSQNVLADLAGKTLEVSGYIRTENATEAAIWLQCWATQPLRVVHGATTFDTTPVYGTQDWQHVFMTVRVPESSQFVTCRCVLRGRGAAWFDDVLVTISPATLAGNAGQQPDRMTSGEPPVSLKAPTRAAKNAAATTSPSVAARAAMNRSLGQLLAEPEVERSPMNFDTPWTYPFAATPPGTTPNPNLLQWLHSPAPLPSNPIDVDQEQRQ